MRIPCYKPLQRRAVVSALQVVQSGLAVVVVAGVAEGQGDSPRIGDLVAPGVVVVLGDDAAGFGGDGLDVTTLVVVDDVDRAVLLEGDHSPGRVVVIVECPVRAALLYEIAGGVPVVGGRALGGGLAPPGAVLVVGVCRYQAAAGYLVDLDELVQGVVGVIEVPVAGQVAVLIIGEAGAGNLVGAVVGVRSTAALRAAGEVPVLQPAVVVVAEGVGARP